MNPQRPSTSLEPLPGTPDAGPDEAPEPGAEAPPSATALTPAPPVAPHRSQRPWAGWPAPPRPAPPRQAQPGASGPPAPAARSTDTTQTDAAVTSVERSSIVIGGAAVGAPPRIPPPSEAPPVDRAPAGRPALDQPVDRPAVDRHPRHAGGGPGDARAEHTGQAPTKPRRNWNRSLIEWTAVLAGALLVALLIKVFLVQAFVIPSESMVPTLGVGDRVLVNKLSYHLHDIHRGDVVVFERPPAARTSTDDSDLIKRVIGLPGDTVEGRDGVVVVNGRPLREPYLPPDTPIGMFAPVSVGPGQVFVMGDNRDHSSDSRFFGPVPESLVVGRAFVRVWPLESVHLL